jgi:hypothetical protein
VLQLKLLLAFVVLHYDVELVDKGVGAGSRERWFGNSIGPPDGARLRVRWRAEDHTRG